MPGGKGGVNEGADDGVEDGLDTQLRLRGQHLAHDRVAEGGVDAGDADFLDQPLRLPGGEVDVDAQSLQHVGAAGEAGNGAASVLGHRDACGGGHQGGGSGDVEGGKAAAGAAGVHQLCGDMWAQRHTVGPHGFGKSGQLLQAGALHEQTHSEAGDLYVADFTLVNGRNKGKDFLFGQLLTGGDLGHNLLIPISSQAAQNRSVP